MSQPIVINNESGGGSGSILGSLIPSRVWAILGILLIVVAVFAIYSGYNWYQDYIGETCPESQGLSDVGFCVITEEAGLDDTGESLFGSLTTAVLWSSPLGYLGAVVGIRTEGDTAAARFANNFDRVKDSGFTFLRRLTGR